MSRICYFPNPAAPYSIHGQGPRQCSRSILSSVADPKIGGLAVILGGFLGAFTLDATTFNLVSFLAISALPVFLGGLGEDVGFNVSAKMRLVLSFASALLAGMLFGAWIPRMGVPVLEILTLYTFPAIILTLLISGGISHSLNLIDGLNGLAIGVSIVIALGLMSVAVSVGDYQISYILLLIIGALLGLLVFNYPFGKLFLGMRVHIARGISWHGLRFCCSTDTQRLLPSQCC